jgi:hypothetical protein
MLFVAEIRINISEDIGVWRKIKLKWILDGETDSE